MSAPRCLIGLVAFVAGACSEGVVGGLVALGDDVSMAHMTVVPGDGTEEWEWAGASLGEPCSLEYASPELLHRVDWRLDPAGDPPMPDSETVDVLLSERECVSGQEIGDRLVGPQVVMTTETRIAFAANPPEGGFQTCPGNPETPYQVRLPVRLGAREIVVGLSLGIELSDYLD